MFAGWSIISSPAPAPSGGGGGGWNTGVAPSGGSTQVSSGGGGTWSFGPSAQVNTGGTWSTQPVGGGSYYGGGGTYYLPGGYYGSEYGSPYGPGAGLMVGPFGEGGPFTPLDFPPIKTLLPGERLEDAGAGGMLAGLTGIDKLLLAGLVGILLLKK